MAAVRAVDTAGAIASRNGSASVAPMPLRTVRRGNDLSIKVMSAVSSPAPCYGADSWFAAASGAARIVNCGLRTMPVTIADQRYPDDAAPRTIRRTAGRS